MPDTLNPGTDTTSDTRESARADGAQEGEAQAYEAPVDVAVVGAGPVGLLLACLLVQRGLSVAVLESREQGSEHSRAIGIHPPGLAVLAQLGLAEPATAAGTPIFRGEAWCDGETLGGLDISEAGGRYPFVLALPQRDTERLLRERLVELCGGHDPVRRGARVVAFAQRGDVVHVELASTSTADLRARYLVGADGPRSRVREYSRIRWRSFGAAQPYLMGDFRSSAASRLTRPGPITAPHAPTTALLAFERGGVVESFPLPGGWRRWVVLTESLQPEATAAELAATVRQRTGFALHAASGTDSDAADAERSARSISAFAVQQHLATRMAVGRIALVGDAAHEVSPIGGQGMNLGWLDAARLAPLLVDAVHDGTLPSAALARYDTSRRRRARWAARQAELNMALGRPVDGSGATVRDTLLRAVLASPARHTLASVYAMQHLR